MGVNVPVAAPSSARVSYSNSHTSGHFSSPSPGALYSAASKALLSSSPGSGGVGSVMTGSSTLSAASARLPV